MLKRVNAIEMHYTVCDRIVTVKILCLSRVAKRTLPSGYTVRIPQRRIKSITLYHASQTVIGDVVYPKSNGVINVSDDGRLKEPELIMT